MGMPHDVGVIDLMLGIPEPRPALADTDGPFLQFRQWAAQFYAPSSA